VWFGLDWVGLDCVGLDWIGLDWIGLDWIGSRYRLVAGSYEDGIQPSGSEDFSWSHLAKTVVCSQRSCECNEVLHSVSGGNFVVTLQTIIGC
jgi:hypothetical protein